MTREEFISQMGYRDDSPFRNEESIDINTPSGIIDMSQTGIPLMANDRYLPPYSGQHQFEPNSIVTEIPLAQTGWEVPKRKGVRKNKDGTESTHIMRTETDGNGNWFSFPTLFQNEDGTWVDMSISIEEDWMPVYKEALRRGEIIDFGTDKEAAIKFGEGSWKKEMRNGGSLPKFQDVGEKSKHLDEIDLTEINKVNHDKINSATYRDRLRNEYQRAHNKTLSEAELDEMVSKLNVQLTQGENDGNTGRYITKSPDPNALGFMVDGYGRIREEGMTTTPYEMSNYPNDFSKGNIYMSAYAGNNPYYTTNNSMDYRESDNKPLGHTGALGTQNSILNHEVNHRLNSLKGTPLSSGADPSSDEYKQSAAYHNSFFSNADITNPYHPDFENTEFGNYAKQPYEIKSQKAQLEQALSHAGIWNPNDGEFTQDHVNKLVEEGFTIPEEGGLDYLYKGLGIDKLVNPSNTEIPVNTMTDFIGDNPDNHVNSNSYSHLTNAGYDKYIGTDRQKDGRMNTHTTAYEGAKRRIANTDYGSKELQDWSKKQQVLNAAKNRSRSDLRDLKGVLEYGVNDRLYDDDLEILKTHGITPSGPNGTLTEADITEINNINTKLQDVYNNDKELFDAGYDVQPSERGADNAYNKQKKIELNRVNKRNNENIKSWNDVDNHRSWMGWDDENRNKYFEDNTGHANFLQGIDNDIEMAQNWMSTYGGYDNVAAWRAAAASGNATQFSPRTRSNINYNTDVANAYMLDNSYTPPHQYNDGWGYGEEEDRDQYNTNYNTAISNNVWPENQHTQAVMSLPASQRDAMMWYYGDENKAPTTPEEFREYHRKLNIVKSSAPNIRDWYINSANTNNQYISEQNEIYNQNLQKVNNSNTLQKKKTNEEVAPNLIDFMNNVADASEEIPQDNQYGISDEDMGDPLLSKYGAELPKFQKKGESRERRIATEKSIYPDGEFNLYNPADVWRYFANENETTPLEPLAPESAETIKNRSEIPMSFDEYKIEKPKGTVEQYRKYIRNPKYSDWRMHSFNPSTHLTKKGWADKEYYRGLDDEGVEEVQTWLIENGYDIKKDSNWGDSTYNAINNYLLDSKLLNKETVTDPLLTNDLLINQQYIESDGDPKAGSNKGAQGLVQAMEGAWSDAIKRGVLPENAKRTNPNHSLLFQRYYMNGLMKAGFVQDGPSDDEKIARALSAYNWGRGNTPNFFNNINYVATDETIKNKDGDIIESGFRNKLDKDGNPILVPEDERRNPLDMESWMTILDTDKESTRWTIPKETVDYINLIMYPEKYIKMYGQKEYDSRIKSPKKYADYKEKANKFFSYKNGGAFNRTKQPIREYKSGGVFETTRSLIRQYNEGGEVSAAGLQRLKEIGYVTEKVKEEVQSKIIQSPHQLPHYGEFGGMTLDEQVKLYTRYINSDFDHSFSEAKANRLSDKIKRIYNNAPLTGTETVLDYMKSLQD